MQPKDYVGAERITQNGQSYTFNNKLYNTNIKEKGDRAANIARELKKELCTRLIDADKAVKEAKENPVQ